MQRFGNLKVGSVFGILHPKFSVFCFQKRKKEDFYLFFIYFFQN